MSEHWYEEAVLRTYGGGDDLSEKLLLGALGLAGEAGEVAEIVKKWKYHGRVLDAPHLFEELGDVLWYVALICTAFGYTVEDVMGANVRKLEGRYPDGFLRG